VFSTQSAKDCVKEMQTQIGTVKSKTDADADIRGRKEVQIE
jgi:hypothetical protein